MKKLKMQLQMFATAGVTKLENMVDPEVMAPMISAKLKDAIVATPFAKVDTTLQGRPGSTITVPKYLYIGDAEDVAEGVAVGVVKLETTTAEYTIKKAMKAVTITDEAILSGYGNPVGEANSQLGKSIANKVDNDVIEELMMASLRKTLEEPINYNGVVDAIGVFNEEENVPKVMFINPEQVTTLRKDTNFISNDKYNENVIMRGEIGMIANTRIVPSRKITLKTYEIVASTVTGATEVTASNIDTFEGKTIRPVKVGEYVKEADAPFYANPIVQLRPESETGDETSAVTIYLKRGVNVETERHTLNRTTDISVDEVYAVALTDESKVVIATFPKTTTI